jgi:hypothetical protein
MVGAVIVPLEVFACPLLASIGLAVSNPLYEAITPEACWAPVQLHVYVEGSLEPATLYQLWVLTTVPVVVCDCIDDHPEGAVKVIFVVIVMAAMMTSSWTVPVGLVNVKEVAAFGFRATT